MTKAELADALMELLEEDNRACYSTVTFKYGSTMSRGKARAKAAHVSELLGKARKLVAQVSQ